MNQNKLKSPIFYGWVIVVIGALGQFFSGPGQTYSVSIFSQAYIEEFGWSRSMVSGYYSLATLFAGFALPFIGRLVDLKGQRKMMTSIAFILGLVCLWMSFVMNPWMLFIGFMMLRLFGQGSMTLLPSTLVPQWFLKNRGKALSLMAIGGVTSSALLPPLNTRMISSFGISNAWIVWSVLLMFFMAPMAWFLVKNRPEDIDQVPDGHGYLAPNKNNSLIVDNEEQAWTLQDAMKTRPFWLMLFCMLIPSMINTGITFHMVSIISEKGFDALFAAFILSVVAISQMPMTFVAGFVVDKVPVHLVKAVNYMVLLVAIVLVLVTKTPVFLIGYGVVHGIFNAFDSVSTGVLWPNYYGRKYLGSIRGITMTAMVIGSALGPLPFGFAFDHFGGYREILTFMMLFPILGSLASFFSPAPKLK